MKECYATLGLDDKFEISAFNRSVLSDILIDNEFLYSDNCLE